MQRPEKVLVSSCPLKKPEAIIRAVMAGTADKSLTLVGNWGGSGRYDVKSMTKESRKESLYRPWAWKHAMSSACEEKALSVLVDPRQNGSFVHVAPYEHIY